MPRRAKELSASEVRRLSTPGFHAVGGVSGLYLRINDADGKSWVLRTMISAKRRDIGLGGFPDVSIASAREAARSLKLRIAEGIDPVEERKARKAAVIAAQKQGKTFAEAVEDFLASNKLDGLRNEKHRNQWGSTLHTYAVPKLGEMRVADITVQDVKAVLDPIWLKKHETAMRLRGRIETVLSGSAIAGHRTGENPARWKGNLSELMPKVHKSDVSENQPTLAVSRVSEWFAMLLRQDGLAARALAFLTLTAARSGEVRGAIWSEIDVDQRLWIIPAQRMKARKEHRVPLSDAAIRILDATPRMMGSEHVFPSSKGKALSDMTLSAVMRRMHEAEVKAGRHGWLDPRLGRAAVPHGLRSTFRDWVAERTDYPRDMAEMALAHIVGSEVERAYRRGDMLEKRRAMMEDWARFVASAGSHGSRAA